MNLRELTTLGLDVDVDCDVTTVVADNRRVVLGALFAGVPGERVHGMKFADDAVARGAVAILTDAEGARMYSGEAPVIVTEDVAGILGSVASLIHGGPATKLTSFAVTGTNGKTTTTYIIDHILTRLGRTTGLIGTVELKIAGAAVPAELTTPQPADLQALLADLVEAGGTDLVMEVSSHALAQGRTSPVQFTVAGFTNLTQDHLDYHASLEEYFEAKASLFDPAKSVHQVIWTDDPYGLELFEGTENAVWVGRVPREGRGYLVEGDAQFTVTTTDHVYACGTALPGDFNVANAALALAMCAEAGIENLDSVCSDLSPVVPGRMEVIAETPRVIVDFAHNPQAIESAISSLAAGKGRLITVTGSAGDRDREKRPIMGEIAARLSDVLIVTDDDPHGEDPAQIRAEVLAGTTGYDNVIEIGDRTEAITEAIAMARGIDTVFLAGRGHETIQEIAGVNHTLDDREVARAALATWKEPR